MCFGEAMFQAEDTVPQFSLRIAFTSLFAMKHLVAKAYWR
jgi:hypothetical protein